MRNLYNRFAYLGIALLIGTVALAQIPNPGFENWTAGEPDGWTTSNVLTWITITQSSTAHTGSSSARGAVISLGTGLPNLNAIMQTGSGGRGFPMTTRYTTCTGYYQFTAAGGDMFGVNVLFKDANGHGVAVGAAKLPAASSWTQFNITMNYGSSNAIDTGYVQILIVGPVTGADVHVGSVYLVDDVSLSGVSAVQDDRLTPVRFALEQNYPNPFNPSTLIRYALPSTAFVTLEVFNVLGQRVAVLENGEVGPGFHEARFDGSRLSSGMYFCRMLARTSDNGASRTFVDTKQLVLTK